MNERDEEGNLSVCTPSPVFTEFVNVITRQTLEKPLSLLEATEVVQDYRKAGIKIIHQRETQIQTFLELLRSLTTRRKVFDVVLSATLIDNGISGLYTVNVSDFDEFKFLEVLNPLKSEARRVGILSTLQLGETVVINKECKECHSIRGVGRKIGPDFMDLNLDQSLTQIAGQMWNHGPKMWEQMKKKGMAVPTFAKGEMADAIAYLYKLKLEDVQGDTAKGREVLDKKQCLSCHSLQGKGAGVSADLAASAALQGPSKMRTAMWNHAPAMREKIGEKQLQWPKFDDGKMAHLYAYCSPSGKSLPTPVIFGSA